MTDEELKERRAFADSVMRDVMKAAEKCADQMGTPWIMSDLKQEHPEWFERPADERA